MVQDSPSICYFSPVSTDFNTKKYVPQPAVVTGRIRQQSNFIVTSVLVSVLQIQTCSFLRSWRSNHNAALRHAGCLQGAARGRSARRRLRFCAAAEPGAHLPRRGRPGHQRLRPALLGARASVPHFDVGTWRRRGRLSLAVVMHALRGAAFQPTPGAAAMQSIAASQLFRVASASIALPGHSSMAEALDVLLPRRVRWSTRRPRRALWSWPSV